jgi:hypothetical protein
MIHSVLLGMLGLGGIEIIIVFFVLIAFIVPFVFYLITLQNTFKLISTHNRKMEPGNVWLMFIPLFNLGWRFVIVLKMAESLKAEFAERNISVAEQYPGKGIGIAYCVCLCCSIVPFLGILASVGGLVCWIIYWVKISEYKALLENSK